MQEDENMEWNEVQVSIEVKRKSCAVGDSMDLAGGEGCSVDRQAHWDKVYEEKVPTAVSWYRPHLERSLELIERFATSKVAAILDIGGGASTLVDDLLSDGFEDVSVLDISGKALEASQVRLGERAGKARWIAADFLGAELEKARYDICHDRAVFHFLNDGEEKTAYFEQVERIIRPDGVLILATFALEGPERCSGLPVSRYGVAELRAVVLGRFEIVASQRESHHTPWGSVQEMMYFVLRRSASSPWID
jgi:SAM-dependent methyltransferase